MAYIVSFKNKVSDLIWHCGEPKPVRLTDNDCGDIEYITADGHELAYILEKFKNIPCLTFDHVSPHSAPRGYVMTWYGDIAKFIAANL